MIININTMSEDEEFWERDPSWTFVLPQEKELFFIKKLFIAERKSWTMGVFISDFFFKKKDLNFVIHQLHFFANNGFIEIQDVNYAGFKMIVDSYNPLKGITYNEFVKNDDDYSDVVFRYEIVRKKELLNFLDEKIQIFQSDIIYNELGEPYSKYSPDIKKLDNIILPFQQQSKIVSELLRKQENDYFELILEQKKQVNILAVLLVFEKQQILKIVDMFVSKNDQITVQIEMPKNLNNKMGTMIKKTSDEIINILDTLITTGINITRNANENNALAWINNDPLHILLKDYQLWKNDIKNKMDENEIYKLSDIGIFYQGDGIPDFISGMLYEYVGSPDSQKLIKTIRIETEKKLDLLRKLKSELFTVIRAKESIMESVKEIKYKFPYKLPSGTIWENFIIQFIDDENVHIQVKGKRLDANYKDIGFAAKKGNKICPSVNWTFLRVLAVCGGEISIDSPQRRITYKKQKELITNILQSYFGIEYDPFYPYSSFEPYKTENSYKIKITLIPPPDKVKKNISNEEIGEEAKKDIDEEIRETYDPQTPLVYEKE